MEHFLSLEQVATTERQLQILQHLHTFGRAQTLQYLGISAGTLDKTLYRLRKKLEQKLHDSDRGHYPPEDVAEHVPPSHHLSKVTTQVDKSGNVKTKSIQAKHGTRPIASEEDLVPPGSVEKFRTTLVNGDGKVLLQYRRAEKQQTPEDYIASFERALKAHKLAAKRPTKGPNLSADSRKLLNVIPVGDPHLGQLSWNDETGANWNLDIAAEMHYKALRRLIHKSPEAHTCLQVWMGDNSHADNSSNETPRGKHKLDVDSRWERVQDVLFATLINGVELALPRHQQIIVRIIKGNHDPHAAASLAMALEAYYRNEPRVIVERQPVPVFVMTWGRVLLSFIHGHEPPPDRVPGILMSDYREEVGRTEQSYLYSGHKHSKILAEKHGVIMEAVQTIAAKDSFAANGGWRSGRSIFVDTFHEDLLAPIERSSVAAQDLGVLE